MSSASKGGITKWNVKSKLKSELPDKGQNAIWGVFAAAQYNACPCRPVSAPTCGLDRL